MDALRREHDRLAVDRAGAGLAGPAPVFVVGAPRTGTSLMERMLGAHPELHALGEPPGFDRALHDLAQARGARSEVEVRRLALALDPQALARRYLSEVGEDGRRRFIDKRPGNTLNVAAIRAALPDARVLLVDREPMDAGWALLKTPFAGAYPWSYDLDDLGRWLAAHGRLADRWAAEFPETVLRVGYERLVARPEAELRRVLDFCGLPWSELCLRFHLSPAPATSASALQVRRPVYASSVGAWRRLESELAPLRARLEAEGARVDAGLPSPEGAG